MASFFRRHLSRRHRAPPADRTPSFEPSANRTPSFESSADRTLSFPNVPPFTHLVKAANDGSKRTIICNPEAHVEATAARLLHDVASLIRLMRETLDAETIELLDRGTEDVFLGLLVWPGYEFIVAICAFKALGASFVPLWPVLFFEDAEELMSLCNAKGLVAASDMEGSDIMKAAVWSSVPTWRALRLVKIQIEGDWTASCKHHDEYTLGEFSPHERAGVLWFKRGTTGRPKGVLHVWPRLTQHAENFGSWASLGPDDLYLHTSSTSSVGGCLGAMDCLARDVRIEFWPGTRLRPLLFWPGTPFSSEIFWDRMCRGDVTFLIHSPRAWLELSELFERSVRGGPDEEKYATAMMSIKTCCVSSAWFSEKEKEWWSRKTGLGKTDLPMCAWPTALYIVEDEKLPSVAAGSAPRARARQVFPPVEGREGGADAEVWEVRGRMWSDIWE